MSFRGGYGDVFKASYQGKPVAIKRMRMFQDTDQWDLRRRFCREALVWQRLRSLYIVPLIGIDTESCPPYLCLVSPWMKHGTVLKYLSTVSEHSRNRTIGRLIAEGLAFLHDERVVHGDLRGANILVDEAGHACLTDFGLTIVNDVTTAQTRSGSGCVRWMAPETLHPEAFGVQNRPRTFASDIFAFGCTCLEASNAPFHDAHLRDAAVGYQVVLGIRPKRPPGDVIPDGIWRIIEKCWAQKFADRPSILGILLELNTHDRPAGKYSVP
ncbi:kinase-like domain-containing protein [Mycena filopes]|nr:kinase-like domain-containing protein [Mycena filopes]